MKVLVFGGSGFLGSHVADALSDAGHEVTIFDLVKSPWLRSDQKFVSGDLLDEKIVSEIVSGFDIVYNFAALADLNQALDKPVDTIRINVLGNTYILEACRKHKIKRFLYASTVYVYSREGGFYRCSKQASESYIEEYQKSFGLDFTILRYGSLYGPRSDDSNGLYRIVKSALETGRITYEGSADSLREYIHVEDAARASVVAMGDEFKNQSVVLTGQEPMRVIDLLKMLAEILGRPDSVEFLEGDQVGHYVRTPYAYQPKLGRKYIPPMHVDLGQGLLQLIDEIKNSSKLGN
ncbi:NAD(P)-dependent oxidoreductase [Leptospira sp. 2 VSF19]|uniref:NAD(P)-dependent oxidoreductase n=1 Tax=Leptospira soteropolitanensis TaxID=2950025 RepID=A0AAW5VQ78_9LEPT|nr:NAD(P)-dependent oxidoreductase [Leptospira soteropolitanensis]MCW7493166.1 NAD(P)-dependent oxidoreductase [Leptospira soteropolitanensis]MCW7500765.1 NAD(P)-dependent oxidoreductase [Leptospira soteropolitanensis]MCW7523016.1 NAD(P)-dependent oxidoreductase [Leptospira soteropolitanensis]MCW7526877.1 NAD(P)-dependent oxidoreductase [Leptospira soteropolitanensis]MCW7530734.1 NAD(P)-dependent oxidoreductase [Leptospira soteropolitanensis]